MSITLRNGRVIQFESPNTSESESSWSSVAEELLESDTESDISIQTPTVTMATVITKKKLLKWALQGLDISDSGFNKLHSKESHYDKDKKLYDLNPESFKRYRDDLIEKCGRMYAKKLFTTPDDDNGDRDILKEYSRLTETNVIALRDLSWPTTDPTFTDHEAANKFTDRQIKSSTIGNYINESLDVTAKDQLKAEEAFFLVSDTDGNTFFDGPSYYFKLTELVDPDNGQLVDDVRNLLRTLRVQDFGYSVIKMLAEFKNLKTRVEDLGGVYSLDEQFFDFWSCVETMKEEEFRRFVKNEKDIYSETPRSGRNSIDKYMKKFKNKEVRMKHSKEWNVMSPKDAMVMALVNFLEEKPDNSKKDSIKKPKGDKGESNTIELTPAEQANHREDRIPDWKKVEPKEDSTSPMERDGHTYYWCTKCCSGKGMWALHSKEEHKDNFKFKSTTSEETSKVKDDKENKIEKRVSFKEESGTPSIKVKKSLLKNAKSYLAQFQDFQEGGSQAE